MIIQPSTWGFICTNAHPQGCQANVRDQIAHVQRRGIRSDGPQRVLVIGASAGYGLAARITAAFGFRAATLGVFMGKPARRKRTASAGWYNTAAFESEAREAGLTSLSLSADAFSHATRARAIDLIRTHLNGAVDLVIYSLASPQRRLPDSGEVVQSALRPIGEPWKSATIDTDNDCLARVEIPPASEQEIDETVAVMGGDDWRLWMEALQEADVLAADAKAVAFSYQGSELTWPIYRNGTIGRAKEHLENTAREMCRNADRPDFARVAMLKSIVTQASAAIPAIPLYLSIVNRVMRERRIDEAAIGQQERLFHDYLYPVRGHVVVDEHRRLRLDEHELNDEIQARCKALWQRVTDANLLEITDYPDYKKQFLQLFGFARDDIDYARDVDPAVAFRPETVSN